MNLRKAILSLTLLIFFGLMFTVLQSYTFMTALADNASTNLAGLVGGNLNALMVWLQFPLMIVVALLLVYLTWWDESLTKSSIRSTK